MEVLPFQEKEAAEAFGSEIRIAITARGISLGEITERPGDAIIEEIEGKYSLKYSFPDGLSSETIQHAIISAVAHVDTLCPGEDLIRLDIRFRNTNTSFEVLGTNPLDAVPRMRTL